MTLRRLSLLLLAIAFPLTVGACAGGTHVIPWTDQKPAASKYRPPPLAHACTAKDLRATLALQGATQNLAGPLTLTNVSDGSCALVRKPKLSFTGAAAKAERWKLQLIPSPVRAGPGDKQAPIQSLRALQSGASAVTYLFWGNWCGPGSAAGGGSGAEPEALELHLQGGSSALISLRQWGAPPCGDPRQPAFLQVSAFQPTIKQYPANSRLPLRVRIVGERTIHHDGPRLLLHPGKVFHYEIALTNTSGILFRFKSCPVYIEGLALGSSSTYALNCRSTGTIGPRKTALFAMEFSVPVGARLGNGGLGWLLAPHTNNPPSADAAVLVAR